MKKNLLILFSAFCIPSSAEASHLLGGEITWQCQPNGQFIFTLIIYGDCSGIPVPTGAQTLEVYGKPGLTSIALPNWSSQDITYCQPLYNCNNAPPSATEQGVYVSNPVTLNGVPSASGWTFAWHSCCRSNAVQNINAAGFSLRATMYAFNGQNTNPCYDSSPVFAEKPKSVLCTTTPYIFNHGAFDPDLDSMSYEWGIPLEEPTNTPPAAWSPGINPVYTSFNPPYTPSNPLPFSPPNIGATIDPHTGEINFTSFLAGNFNTNVKVTAFKCGVKVSEIFREIQLIILNCTVNNNPLIAPPFLDSTGANTLFADTVMAGDSVFFFLGAFDFDLEPGGQPQSVSLSAYGLQFGNNFSDTAAGCLIPPCAVLDAAMPVTAPMLVSTNFSWHTTVDHLGLSYPCAYLPNTYYFNFKATDSHCPAPAVNYKTVAITVLPLYPKPAIQNNNGILTCLANGFNYQWYFNRFTINGATGQSYTPVQTGMYQVRMTDSMGSGNYSGPLVVSTLNGISGLPYFPGNLDIYPNPAFEMLHISFTDYSRQDYLFVLADMTGRPVLEKRIFSSGGTVSEDISLPDLKTGIYSLTISNQFATERKKIVLLRE